MRSNIPDNQLMRILFNSIGMDTVIWGNTDMESLVEDYHNKNADLFSVIDLIVNGFNKVDIVVKRGTMDDFEIVQNGPLFDLMNTPNPSQSQDEFFALYLKFKLTTGNGINWTPRRFPNGPIIEMWTLPSQYTKVISGGWAKPIKGYEVEMSGSQSIRLDPGDVLHIKETNLSFGYGNELYGMSRLKPGSAPVQINNSSQEASQSRFNNRGVSGFLQVIGANSKDEGIAASQSIKNQLQKQGRGAKNEGSIVATGMEVKFIPTTIPAVDLGIFEGQKKTLHQLCNLYHVPPILLDPTVANTYNNIREAQKDLYRNAVIPEVQQFCTAFNRFTRSAYKNEWIDYETKNVECLQTDNQSIVQWLSQAWWLTPNQKLEIMGMPTVDLPEMDQRYIPANMIPLTDQPIDVEPLKGINDYR